MRYGLAPDGVYATVQGEGVLLGAPTVFVRLAGCPVGCPQCDTDYSLAERVDAAEVARRVAAAAGAGCDWAWVTGGEPTAYDLPPLYSALRRTGLKVALATAGVARVADRRSGGPDFLSVSPHRLDESWVQRSGCQINLVPGLGGLTLAALDAAPADWFGWFPHRYLTPLWAEGAPADVAGCAAWVAARPGWRLGVQAHRLWGLS